MNSIDRRSAILGTAITIAGSPIASATAALAASTAAKPLSADEALNRLKQGNARFVSDSLEKFDMSTKRRLALAEGQQPFATLVGCSDSRVGPEQLFGAGLGELFIVRTAGNNVDTAGMGSIEYSVTALGVPLIVVLGHEKCGAVAAAANVVRDGIQLPGSMAKMVEPIIPAVLEAQRSRQGGDLVESAIVENVRRMVLRLQKFAEPMLLEPQRIGKLKVVGAVYSLKTGAVTWL